MKEVTAVATAAAVVAAVQAGHVALSMRFLSSSIEQEAIKKKWFMKISSPRRPLGARKTYRILLDAIGDALEDVLYHRTMVALRLVIAKAHHAPMFADGVPAHFDDAVVDLFAIGLQTGKG
jgi:hypothetical protein